MSAARYWVFCYLADVRAGEKKKVDRAVPARCGVGNRDGDTAIHLWLSLRLLWSLRFLVFAADDGGLGKS
jgi:hypothetical protein